MTDLTQKLTTILTHRGLKIGTVESCTGGRLAAAIVDTPGASRVFSGGHITYSNDLKVKLVEVSPQSLKDYGAVSQKVCEEMAVGGAKSLGVDVCISVTGVAGPTGGTPDKPVGTVWLGFFYKGRVQSDINFFAGERSAIQHRSVQAAIEKILEIIEKDDDNYFE